MKDDEPIVIVCADDNPDILGLVRRRLRHRGYEVVTAENGRDALDAIRLRHPAVAVLDRMMPLMEGAEVCAAVKRDPELAGTRVILLTARASEDDVVGGFEAGADEYLTKPFDIEELDQVLRRLTGSTGTS